MPDFARPGQPVGSQDRARVVNRVSGAGSVPECLVAPVNHAGSIGVELGALDWLSERRCQAAALPRPHLSACEAWKGRDGGETT